MGFLNNILHRLKLKKRPPQYITTNYYFKHLKSQPRRTLINLCVKRAVELEGIKSEIKKLNLQKYFNKNFRKKYNI